QHIVAWPHSVARPCPDAQACRPVATRRFRLSWPVAFILYGVRIHRASVLAAASPLHDHLSSPAHVQAMRAAGGPEQRTRTAVMHAMLRACRPRPELRRVSAHIIYASPSAGDGRRQPRGGRKRAYTHCHLVGRRASSLTDTRAGGGSLSVEGA